MLGEKEMCLVNNLCGGLRRKKRLDTQRGWRPPPYQGKNHILGANGGPQGQQKEWEVPPDTGRNKIQDRTATKDEKGFLAGESPLLHHLGKSAPTQEEGARKRGQ